MPYAGGHYYTPSRKTGSNYTSARQQRKQSRQKRKR